MNFDKNGNIILERISFTVKHEEIIKDLIKEIEINKNGSDKRK